MNRDSLILKLGQAAAVLAGMLALAGSAGDYGLTEVQMRWSLALLTIVGTVTGHLGNSPLKGKDE